MTATKPATTAPFEERPPEGIGLALDHAQKRAFVSDLGGFVRVISLDHPDNGSVVFSGHGPLTGIAYLRG